MPETAKEYVFFQDTSTQSIAEASLIDSPIPEVQGQVYFFNRLKSNKPGLGGGTKVLLQLLEYIDSVGIPLLDQVNAYGNLDQDQLIAYYKKYGFVDATKEYGSDLLIYYPKGSKESSLRTVADEPKVVVSVCSPGSRGDIGDISKDLVEIAQLIHRCLEDPWNRSLWRDTMISVEGDSWLRPIYEYCGETLRVGGADIHIPPNPMSTSSSLRFATDWRGRILNVFYVLDNVQDASNPVDIAQMIYGYLEGVNRHRRFGLDVYFTENGQESMEPLRYLSGATLRVGGADIHVPLADENKAEGGFKPNWFTRLANEPLVNVVALIDSGENGNERRRTITDPGEMVQLLDQVNAYERASVWIDVIIDTENGQQIKGLTGLNNRNLLINGVTQYRFRPTVMTSSLRFGNEVYDVVKLVKWFTGPRQGKKEDVTDPAEIIRTLDEVAEFRATEVPSRRPYTIDIIVKDTGYPYLFKQLLGKTLLINGQIQYMMPLESA